VILKFGQYAHANNEVGIVMSRGSLRDQYGIIYGYHTTWTIRGILQADTQADITTAIAALEAAYSSEGKDAILYLDDGITATAHKLLDGPSFGGVKVKDGPNYPNGVGAEYSTFRTYEITLEASYGFNNAGGLTQFDEVIAMFGGGPRWILIQTLNGPPQRQQTADMTPFYAQQSGSATGVLTWPEPGSPLFPEHEHRDRRRIVLAGPVASPEAGRSWGVSWSYEFESITELFGQPRFKP